MIRQDAAPGAAAAAQHDGAGGVPVLFPTMPCVVCGRVSAVPLRAPAAAALSAGVPVQVLLPELSPGERELLISGTHPTCWAARFGDGEED